MRWTIPILALALAFPPNIAAAQDIRTERLAFDPGTTGATAEDRITGYESVAYTVGAEAGQRMQITLRASNPQTYFNVYAPGRGPGDEALANSGLLGPNVPDINILDGILPTSGDYTVSVYMMRAAARRNEVSDFTLEVSVTGETGEVVQNDFADGLQSGPDFYEVRTEGGILNMRDAPSAAAVLVARIPNGTALRNLGCRMAEGRRWCRVATAGDPGLEGWAAGEFLIEGSAPDAAAAVPAGSDAGTAGGSSDVRVSFAAGASGTELNGTLQPGESRRFLLGASDGQFLTVRVASAAQQLFYQIFNPDSSFLLDRVPAGQDYRGQLWQSGDHGVEVFNLGTEAAEFSVVFGIE